LESDIPPQLGPNEATLDAPSDSQTRNRQLGPPIHLVMGSTPALSGETQLLLRSRLRAASLVMLAGFSMSLLWSSLEAWFLPASRVAGFWYLLAAEAGVTLMLAFSALSVCRRVPDMKCLRLRELVIFGAPAAFFCYWQVQHGMQCATMHQTMPHMAPPWLLLIFTYALFIPNGWRRAAVVVGAMAAAPILVFAGLYWLSAECSAAHNAGYNFVIEHVMLMSVGALASVYGVHTIGRLRREAFEARQLGQYRLRRRLGGGGMGEVYLAEHQLMKRPCAIKIIRPERAGDPTALARFEREVRATAKLSHWNNIDIYDYGRTADGTFYYVMEYLPGKSIADLVKQYGPMPAARVIYLLRQICDALTEAHGVGLIHRDIKPANIFAARRGGFCDVAKLLDFGLVKPISQADDDAQLTQTGSITGSPQYMSPEQALGESEPDARSDIYSLGAVAYFMLTGRPPFDDDRPLRVLFMHASENPAAPSELVANVPPDLEAVVLRCLAKKPDDRFAGTAELAQALDQCSEAGRWAPPLATRWWDQHAPEDEPVDASSSEILELATSTGFLP
jgi:eukaryotic-like serine/threonine-protein kinase